VLAQSADACEQRLGQPQGFPGGTCSTGSDREFFRAPLAAHGISLVASILRPKGVFRLHGDQICRCKPSAAASSGAAFSFWKR
jgi:hypothetical protein